MERIDGFDLDGLLPSPLTVDKWECVLQKTVNAAKEISVRGVVLGDCGPGNVLVQTNIGNPASDEELSLAILQTNNPRHTAWWLASRVEKEKGIKLRIVYPDLGCIFHLKTGYSEKEKNEKIRMGEVQILKSQTMKCSGSIEFGLFPRCHKVVIQTLYLEMNP